MLIQISYKKGNKAARDHCGGALGKDLQWTGVNMITIDFMQIQNSQRINEHTILNKI